jgi:type II restriction enzyme
MGQVPVANITERLVKLSEGQLAMLNGIVDTFLQEVSATRRDDSDVVSPQFLDAFGDILKLHHSLSNDYLDKHRFEAAMERVYRVLGVDAHRPNRNNPGHDLSVGGVPWSLKTQGDNGIKLDFLHISKFMEMGKGKWETESDLPGLRDRFIQHMLAYQRIFQLRYFRLEATQLMLHSHYYELVEIPKSLLLQAQDFECVMSHSSKQNPKPGYCTVTKDGIVSFRLYFDGGSERKLQIKDIRKSLCIVHATWEF